MSQQFAYQLAEALIKVSPNESNDTYARVLGSVGLTAGAALALYKGAKIPFSGSLALGTYAALLTTKLVFPQARGEHSLLKSFVIGFLSTGVLAQHFA